MTHAHPPGDHAATNGRPYHCHTIERPIFQGCGPEPTHRLANGRPCWCEDPDSHGPGVLMGRPDFTAPVNVAAYGIPWPQSYDPHGMHAEGVAIDNPSTADDADVAIERARALVDALDEPTRALVYHLLHARGCRVSQGSYVEEFKRRWRK